MKHLVRSQCRGALGPRLSLSPVSPAPYAAPGRGSLFGLPLGSLFMLPLPARPRVVPDARTQRSRLGEPRVVLIARPATGSMRGGRAAAVLYTLIESCKLVGVDVLAYLADVLVRVATHPARRIDELLPANWAKRFAASASA